MSPTHQNWIREQRVEYQKFLNGLDSHLDEEKINALNKIDPNWWKTKRQRNWEHRLRQLQAYKEEHGDCCVPITYKDPKLANWVSNLRKRYNMKNSGSYARLTQAQIDELNDIGFVWSRWDYEYKKRLDESLASKPELR